MPKELSLNDQKKRLLELLKYLNKICKEHKINYFLDSGTLLGAVRHKGFIPWDDDIDVIMPRDDYKKLLNILKEEKNHYRVIHRKNSSKYYLPFAKLVDYRTISKYDNIVQDPNIGLGIDLFPMDGIPEKKFKRKVLFFTTKLLQKLSISSVVESHNNKIRNLIPFYIGRVFNSRKLLTLLDRVVMHYNYNDSKFVGSIVSGAFDIYLEKKWFEESISVEFEGELYPAPKGYKNYLETLYGEYMKLPPIESQISHHDVKVYLRK